MITKLDSQELLVKYYRKYIGKYLIIVRKMESCSPTFRATVESKKPVAYYYLIKDVKIKKGGYKMAQLVCENIDPPGTKIRFKIGSMTSGFQNISGLKYIQNFFFADNMTEVKKIAVNIDFFGSTDDNEETLDFST